ncbi:response regulator transcription factor [Brevibacillus borstelensis]|uniref:response regulator transcription factor n=1 Tax=Brevibacillus borstelensis TaxID=45462 RepID=UPI0030BE2E86
MHDEKLAYFFRYYEASDLSCGMIAVRCRERGDSDWKELQPFLADKEPEHAAQLFYDEKSKRLVILLDGASLAQTHYLALSMKEHLQKNEQLAGGICVAGYPESGASMGEILMEMTARLTHSVSFASAIQVVARHEHKWERRPRLLLVENDPVIQQILVVRLARNGYEIFLAGDGMEGKEKVQQVQPDLVITELTLPVMNGYQLIDWLKAQHEPAATDRCKIVVLTDKRLEEDMSQCFRKGVADFLTKPFSPVELDWRIKRLLVS